MSIKYSIIVPVYKVGKYCINCMQRLFDNQLKDCELIIINDQTPDDSIKKLSKFFVHDIDETIDTLTTFVFQGTPVTAFSERNIGLSGARNAGIRLAKGEYILFIDPDDSPSADYFDSIDEAVENSMKPDLLLYGFYLNTENKSGKIIEQSVVMPKRNYVLQNREAVVRELLPNFLGYSVKNVQNWLAGAPLNPLKEWGGVWRMVYKRSVMMENNIWFDEKTRLGEDLEFDSLYIACATSAVSLHKALYHYTIRPTGLLSQGTKDNGNIIIDTKFQRLEEKKIIQDLLENDGFGITINDYAGSNVFSILEMMIRCDDTYWYRIRRFIADPVVKRSIQMVPLGRKITWSVPVLLLKLGLYRFLFLGVKLILKFGINPPTGY